ncbi:MAG: hypothetical protein IAF38_11745, partial [Bacteroidia bacterium]|nr:hypothetical protein [Bacteroidia bacterium]
MKVLKIYFLAMASLASSIAFSQQGKDGPRVIAATTSVNEYTTLSTSVSAGANTLPVTASTLNANGRFTGNLAPGDLVMIYQVRGVFINGFASGIFGSPNDSTWGRPNDLYNTGKYEFAEVRSVPNGTSIVLDCNLQNSYDINSFFFKAIVIRVPRYTTLTINSPGVLTCDDWNGTIGGVLAVEVQGNTVINAGGSVNANAKGFRGGSLVGDNLSTFGVSQAASTDGQYGAEKGEGVTGYQSDYDLWGGRYGRNAAANAGGGGNAHNAGGGGGANASPQYQQWHGYGIPDLTGVNYNIAWGLDNAAIPGYNAANTAGGGRGGYSFSSSNQNAITTAPGAAAWAGDLRNKDATGFGGRALDYSTGRLYFGGGGGAGDQNNSGGGIGGDGGGLVYLMVYGNISGGGTVTSNGSAGANGQGGTGIITGIDAGGGGGAGGVIVLNAVGGVANTLTCNTNGGVGGNQVINLTGSTAECEGPGGGGGGGYIGISSGAPTRNSNGGNNGTTNSSSLTEFTPNGAMRGCPGITNGTITNFTISAVNATICSGQSANLTATLGGTTPGGISIIWYDALVAGNQLGTGSPFNTGALTSTTTFYVGTCPGTYRIPVTVTVNALPTVTITATSPVCAGAPPFNLSGSPATGTWSGTGITNATNGTFDPSTTGTGTFTVTYSYTDVNGCSNTDTEPVVVNAAGTATITAVAAVCTGTAAFNMSAAPAGGTWSGTGITNAATGTFNPATAGAGAWTITYTVAGACPATDQETVTVNATPAMTSANTATICSGNAVNIPLTSSVGSTYTWIGNNNANTTGESFATQTTATLNNTIINTGTAVETVIYTVTPTSSVGSCPGPVQQVTVTINPTPTMTSANTATICSGNTVTIPLTSNVGSTYTWIGNNNANTTGESFATQTTATLNNTIINTSTAVQTVIYTVTPTSSVGSCPGTVQQVTVTINPTPAMTSANTATICSGNAVTIPLTSNVGSTY